MKKPAWLKLWLPVFICFTLWTFSLPCSYGAQKADAAQADKDKKAIVKRARDGYYSLRKLGLVKFEASITPNWEVTLKDQIKSDPSSAQASLKLLNGLHFAMDLGADGNVKVTHHTDVAPANEQMAASFDQIYGGMEQAVSGFFASWSIFMLTSPFPEVESEYKLEEIGGEYRLSYKEGNTDIVTSMTRDLAITEIKVSTSAFTSSLKPILTKGPHGFVLSGYDGNYVPTSGSGTVQLKAQIDYQEVEGLQLLHTVSLDSVYDGSPNQMELTFADYQVKHQ